MRTGVQLINHRKSLPEYRLCPDYTACWPLWGPGGYVSDPAAQLPISPALLEEMRLWVVEWENQCPAEIGWKNEFVRNQWIDRGNKIYANLCIDLAEHASVTPLFRTAYTTVAAPHR